VKYASGGSTANFETTDTAYNGTAAVTNGDFFIVKVTAEDSSVRYYKITATVNAPLSSDATLKSTTKIKGLTVTDFGTPASSIGSAVAGSVTLTAVQGADTSNAGSYITSFVANNVAGTVSKIVKYASGGSPANFETTDTAYNGTAAVTNGDFFIVKITAEDNSVRYYKITATVNAPLSSDATLKSTTKIKGVSVTDFGNPAATIGSAVAGSVTLTSVQGADTSNAGSYITSFVANNVAGTVSKIVKYASGGSTANFETTDTAYNGTAAVTNGDFFIVKITAEDNSVRYYKITATVNCTVNYKNNYNSSDTTVYTSQTVVSSSKAAAPEQPARSSYTFEGWYTETACTNAWNFKNNSITGDTNLYAKWAAVAIPTYKVTYASNGAITGNIPVDISDYTAGSTVTVKANTGTLAKSGYTLSGWSYNGRTYTAGQTLSISANATLTAVWTYVPVTYTVTYLHNYTGEGTYTSQTGIASGSTLAEPADPSRTGYTFIGWYKDAACANPWKFNTDTVTSDTMIYAKWAASTYTVSGTVKDDASTPVVVSGAAVKVVQGVVQFGNTVTTDTNGSFTVTGVPDGTYNLVVTKDGQEVTVCIAVSGGNYTYAGTITLPSGNKNSKIEVVGSDTPNVVVDNLNNVFNDSNIYGSSEQNTVLSGGTVEIKLTVQKNDYSANKATVEAAMSSGGFTSGSILDVDLTKTSTSSNGASEESSIAATSNLIKIIIPLPAELQGKANYVIYRAHNYGSGVVADAITTMANPNGEYIVVSSDKTQITTYLKYFSTYAIAYNNSSTTPTTHSGGGSTAISSYVIKATAGTNGSISPSGSLSATAGQSKTFTITADQGYDISDVLVDGKSVGAAASYTFSNINAAHTIEAVFAKAEGLPYYIDDKGKKVFLGFASNAVGMMKYIAPQGKTILFQENPKSFTDVSRHWAKSSIDFVTERELFLGTSTNTFAPETGMTRAMFATVVGRLYERSYDKLVTTGAGSKFSDADYTAYYGSYVDWAAENKIITGVGNGKFEPDRKITREEMAVMLYRFAEYLKISTTGSEDLQLSYPDVSAISSWATDAAKYSQQTGIISGRAGGKFVPKDTATRAEVATIMQRFIENTVK
jgi:uncharacterized repeat protein (TIGR02543 family)